jgi:hypothetical protein
MANSEAGAATKALTGTAIADAYVDKGYRGHGWRGSTRVHIAGAHSKKVARSERKRRRRRSAIEPKIGHLKSDHRVRRCFLSGLEGDAINIVLAAAAGGPSARGTVFGVHGARARRNGVATRTRALDVQRISQLIVL